MCMSPHRVHFAHIRLGKNLLVDTEINKIENSTFEFLYRPLDNIMFILHHQESNVDFLKLDVEGSEWEIFGESIFKVFGNYSLIYAFIQFVACGEELWDMHGFVDGEKYEFFSFLACVFSVLFPFFLYFFSTSFCVFSIVCYFCPFPVFSLSRMVHISFSFRRT